MSVRRNEIMAISPHTPHISTSGFSLGGYVLTVFYAEKVATRALCAIAQAESLRYKLIGGLAVRRACYGVLRFIMESGAKGCEVVVSGKLRGQVRNTFFNRNTEKLVKKLFCTIDQLQFTLSCKAFAMVLD